MNKTEYSIKIFCRFYVTKSKQEKNKLRHSNFCNAKNGRISFGV